MPVIVYEDNNGLEVYRESIPVINQLILAQPRIRAIVSNPGRIATSEMDITLESYSRLDYRYTGRNETTMANGFFQEEFYYFREARPADPLPTHDDHLDAHRYAIQEQSHISASSYAFSSDRWANANSLTSYYGQPAILGQEHGIIFNANTSANFNSIASSNHYPDYNPPLISEEEIQRQPYRGIRYGETIAKDDEVKRCKFHNKESFKWVMTKDYRYKECKTCGKLA